MPAKRDVRILILDGHTNQALACVRSLGKAGYSVFVASHQRLPLGWWSRYCCGGFLLTGQNIKAFSSMREWARKLSVNIVLPVTERSCLLVNAERERWEESAITVGCPADEVLTRAFDKGETIKLADECGVSIPPTHYPASLKECFEAADEVGLPCIVKPRRSNAWNGEEFRSALAPVYINRREELRDAVEACRQNEDWPLIQGYVAGQGKGVFALCRNGRSVAWFAHERLRDARPSGSASSLRRSIGLDGRLREPAERLLAAMEWHGPAMVEFKDDGIEPPCLMEVNGRFWGSLQLGISAGVDFPLMWVSILQGEACPASVQYREGVTVRWLWGDVKRMVSILRGAPDGYPGVYPTVGEGLREILGRQPAGTQLGRGARTTRYRL